MTIPAYAAARVKVVNPPTSTVAAQKTKIANPSPATVAGTVVNTGGAGIAPAYGKAVYSTTQVASASVVVTTSPITTTPTTTAKSISSHTDYR